MALVDNAWYVNYGDGATTGYYSLTVWATGAVIAAGAIRRQLAAPAVGSERVFVCVVAGTTHATTEPTWVITRGGKTTDNTVTWQECTGIAALNGDATNTPSWTITATPPGGVKATAVTLGQVIKRDSGASYQICTTAGTAGSGAEPAFSNTAGTTTADNTITWTSLGVVGNFTGWQAPHARATNAFTSTWGQATNKFFVASEHAETQSSAITLTPPTSAKIYCVSKTTLPPVSANLTTGASVTTTGNSNLTVGGQTRAFYQGIAFNCGTGANATVLLVSGASARVDLLNCALANPATGAGTINTGGSAQSLTIWRNTTVSFGATTQSIQVQRTKLYWLATPSAVVGATLPTSLFSSNQSANAVVQGVDLSALGAATTLVPNLSVTNFYNFIDCKLGASVTIAASQTNPANAEVTTVRCDSGATNYRTEKINYSGSQVIETTIVRTGGATDGTTPIAWKLVTTANSIWTTPFEALPIAIWNDSTSSITVTVYGIWGGGAVPNNDDIWMDVEYLGAAGNPQGSIATATKADDLANGSALTTDTSTWGGSTTKFKMTATFTPAQKGAINIYVKAATASTTFYIDPRPEVSGVTVSKSHILAPGVYANELSSGGGISRARAASGF